jgi:hypothetical protein
MKPPATLGYQSSLAWLLPCRNDLGRRPRPHQQRRVAARRTLCWTKAGATISIRVTPGQPGTIVNGATVSGNENDPDPSNNSATATTQVVGFGSGGAFVVGDRSATGSVLFWGAQWAKGNSLSGGSAPNAFKGFENSTATPTCGSTWTTDPGNSSDPPATIPPLMAVIVSSNITKSGSTISGNVAHIVIVRTDPGYAPNPGHEGTGTVVAVVC